MLEDLPLIRFNLDTKTWKCINKVHFGKPSGFFFANLRTLLIIGNLYSKVLSDADIALDERKRILANINRKSVAVNSMVERTAAAIKRGIIKQNPQQIIPYYFQTNLTVEKAFSFKNVIYLPTDSSEEAELQRSIYTLEDACETVVLFGWSRTSKRLLMHHMCDLPHFEMKKESYWRHGISTSFRRYCRLNSKTVMDKFTLREMVCLHALSLDVYFLACAKHTTEAGLNGIFYIHNVEGVMHVQFVKEQHLDKVFHTEQDIEYAQTCLHVARKTNLYVFLCPQQELASKPFLMKLDFFY